MEFYAIKPSFTYFGYEVYKIKIGKGKIEGTYLGKLFSKKEKLSMLLKSMLYALLGAISSALLAMPAPPWLRQILS